MSSRPSCTARRRGTGPRARRACGGRHRRCRPRSPRACRLHLAAGATSRGEADSNVVRAAPRRSAGRAGVRRRHSLRRAARDATRRAARASCSWRRLATPGRTTRSGSRGHGRPARPAYGSDAPSSPRYPPAVRRRADSAFISTASWSVHLPDGTSRRGALVSPPQIFGLVTELDLACEAGARGDHPAVCAGHASEHAADAPPPVCSRAADHRARRLLHTPAVGGGGGAGFAAGELRRRTSSSSERRPSGGYSRPCRSTTAGCGGDR